MQLAIRKSARTHTWTYAPQIQRTVLGGIGHAQGVNSGTSSVGTLPPEKVERIWPARPTQSRCRSIISWSNSSAAPRRQWRATGHRRLRRQQSQHRSRPDRAPRYGTFSANTKNLLRQQRTTSEAVAAARHHPTTRRTIISSSITCSSTSRR